MTVNAASYRGNRLASLSTYLCFSVNTNENPVKKALSNLSGSVNSSNRFALFLQEAFITEYECWLCVNNDDPV